jgi:hypothetical protein
MLRTPPLRPTTFMSPTVRQAYVNIGFVYLLDYFIFLTHAFTCILGRLRITTRRRAGIRLHRRPLQHDGRIWRQRRDAVVLVLLAVVSVLLSLIVNYIILSCRTYFTYGVVNYIVYLLLCMIIPTYSACFGGSPFREATKTVSSKKIKLLYSLTNEYMDPRVRPAPQLRDPYIHR